MSRRILEVKDGVKPNVLQPSSVQGLFAFACTIGKMKKKGGKRPKMHQKKGDGG